MTTWTRLAVASAVVVTLATPDLAWAQAARRGTSSSSSSAGGGERSAPSAGPRSAPSGAQGGSARPRSGSAPSGSAGTSQGSPGRPPTRTSPGGPSGQAGPRTQGTRPTQGQAQPRIYGGPGGPPRPGYGVPPYYGYYPSYGRYPYYGYYPPYPWYGYGGYAPWYFGFGFGWSHYPYSLGFGFSYPFGLYDPFVPYGYYGGGVYSAEPRTDPEDYRPTGTVRLRANPTQARVYVDGALVGTVDDFDGLTGHLRLEAGAHQIELRAEGYETYTTEVIVRPDRTMTERATLKRIGN